MKRRKLFTLSISAAVFLLCGLLSAGAFSPMDKLSEKYEGDTITEMAETLRTMDYDEICDEFNLAASVTSDESSLMAYAGVLAEKIDTIPETEIMEMIQDKKNAGPLRVTFLQLLGKKEISDLSPVRAVLLDTTENSVVRQNAAFAVMHDISSRSALVAAVSDRDENVAFQSLKALNMVDSVKAQELADDIIENKTDDVRLNMAIKVKAYEYQASPKQTKEISDFISYCKEVYVSTDDPMRQGTVIFALSDLYNEEALRFIVEESGVDSGLKLFCIDQNYLVLKEMLENNPTADDIQFAVTCCNIYPVDEVVTALKVAAPASRGSVTVPDYAEVYQADKNYDYFYYLGRS